MKADFTPQVYILLLSLLKQKKYNFLTMSEAIQYEKGLLEKNQGDDERIVVLRHDVDRLPENAHIIAEIEQNMGINSTFYFRHVPSVFLPELMKKIEKMGHEVGYHYETLTKTRGEMDKALEMFKNELKDFRKYVDVKTVCMHGSAIYHRRALEMWEMTDIEEFRLMGEAYLSIDFNKWEYFSDTGRRWDGKYNTQDTPHKADWTGFRPKTTYELIQYIENNTPSHLYLLIHPNRWNPLGFKWLDEIIKQTIKNSIKWMIITYRKQKDANRK